MESLATMINEINEVVGKSLSITCYGVLWDLYSYKDGSLFSLKNRIRGESFIEVVGTAHALIPTKRQKEVRQNGKT